MSEDKDFKKELENLEQLLEDTMKKQAESNKDGSKNPKKPANKSIRIELGRKYSSNYLIHFSASFLINFIVIFSVITFFDLADVMNEYVFLPIALLFTLYEEGIKAYLFKRQVKLVIYSSGLIFFLSYLIFFYVIDLAIFPSYLKFKDYLYPFGFVVLFQIVRTIIKSTYLTIVRKLQTIGQNRKS
jgi:hypothetical protein